MSASNSSKSALSPFVFRHIGPREHEIAKMLGMLGYSSLDELTSTVVPKQIQFNQPLSVPAGVSEEDALAELRGILAQNKVLKSFIGQGYYGTHTPKVIQRNVLENPAWYTAYTPYQPEISQGRLEVLFYYQTLVTELTGLEIANASLLDEATAAAEAMTLCQRVGKGSGNRFLVSRHCHPQTIELIQTRARPLNIEVVLFDERTGVSDWSGVFGVIVQYPATDGVVTNHEKLIADAHANHALVVMATDLLALMLLKSPGAMGADVAVGNSQRFGVPFGLGGPHAAFMATRDSFKRSMPGRLVGQSIDSHGKPAYRLSLQTREQHIRREKATSNICTAQALLAIMATLYAVYHGPEGLRAIAKRVHARATELYNALVAAGLKCAGDQFFDTVVVEVGSKADAIVVQAVAAGYNLRRFSPTALGISCDETTSPADIAALAKLFGAAAPAAAERTHLPADQLRDDAILTQDVFHIYRSETEMMRYLRRLSEMDIALDRAMISLGSCTMKLNAAAEMTPVTWPEINSIHPFAPADQWGGYREMIAQLEKWLCACTGYDAISLQPNAGSQGEYAGLLAIRNYLNSKGEGQRNVCLIPSSAHGTNPASAQMISMKVVVVACDDRGNIDIADLRAKATQYKDTLAALMITYPSTHGVYEEGVKEICEIIHAHGGQVYMDGANLNAQVGVARPGDIGADVSHVNLHKTFCIPHGGGGPGMGPIGVKKHLAPFLANHAVVALDGPNPGNSAVSAAPWGSAGILPISWTYIAMMGAEGLLKATQVAILSANYIARKLEPHFPVLYTGRNGMVAHECIIDLRPLKAASGISEEDVAKRLMDYGFHAPTMSFPVAGTLMIEPTESEPKQELDRFIQAMISIRKEIARVESGELDALDNPLKHAPHTLADIMDANWQRGYSKHEAAWPVPGLKDSKFWPSVNRIDNVYGDRNLFCACPALETYQ